MADNPFTDPRVAALYDPLEPDRSDLDLYAAIVDELGAASVLDLGCGTGTLACLLARRGKKVIGADPSEAMIDVARAKPGADLVRWLVGDARGLPPLDVDMVTMTGNVAQVFLTDEDWDATLRGAHGALRTGGRLVFETRDPANEAWREWNRDESFLRVTIPNLGVVETWEDLIDVRLPLVTFRSTIRFESTNETVESHSTLRFRTKDEVSSSLQNAGFTIQDIRDAPDRPGRELVFIASTAPQRLASARSDVRRFGDVVVRKTGPWAPSVHGLLRHLERVGFPGAPRVIGDGFDDAGDEVLSFIAGGFVHPRAWSDEGIAALGALLRGFHDATATFHAPPGAIWQPWFTRSDRPDAIVGHGDLGPWNVVARDGLPVGFIDWEFAGPVDRLDEVAQAAWLNAQLHDNIVAARNQLPSAGDRARQLALFVNAYGLTEPERAGLVTRMIEHAVRDAANEVDDAAGLKLAKVATPSDPEADAGWAIAWRVRSAAWLVRNRSLLEQALRTTAGNLHNG